MTIPTDARLIPYERHGIFFAWPDIWELQEQTEGDDVVIFVSSKGTCFWTVRIIAAGPPPPQVVESCVDAFTEEYGECEVSSVDCLLAEMPAFARDVQFSCLDLLNTAALRSARTTDFTLLVWWQGTDSDLTDYQNLLEQMTGSVRIAGAANE